MNLFVLKGDGEVKAAVVVVCKGVNDERLAGGVMAMNEGEARGLDNDEENVEEVDAEGADDRVIEFVLVADKVAGLIISVLVIEGDNFEGELEVCSFELLAVSVVFPDLSREDLDVSCRLD